ncbi:MAG: hypothetical protein AABW46_00535 [Nanoarchaeota archaeon]
MEKRGVSIFVFTIMFTLIAGAIILMFFFNFGSDILDFGDKVTTLQNILVLDKNLASFALSPNSEKTIEFSEDISIDVDCSNQEIFLREGDEEKETKKLIFTPFQLNGRSVQAWTLAWNYPFKIDNLYFLADSNTKFTLDSSSQIGIYFTSKFPRRFTQVTTATNEVKVYFQPTSSPPIAPNIKVVQFIELEGANPGVQFKRGNNWYPTIPVPIWGDAMVFAAIFSADYDQFNCITQGLAKQRIDSLIKIYSNTITSLLSCSEGTNNYNEISVQLRSLSQGDISAARDIKDANDALKLTDCPPLFKGIETERLLQ